MAAQQDYYNRFGTQFRDAILTCPAPHLWTTDYAEKGRVYREMVQRLSVQEQLVDRCFDKSKPVLDVGCGFGRQAYLLARKGYAVVGTDTSDSFVDIARSLFLRHGLPGSFFTLDLLRECLPGRYSQALLLDVLEHIPPAQRHQFVSQLAGHMSSGGWLLLSVPHVKSRLRSQLNNRLRKALTQHLSFFRNHEEHPYPVPQRADINRLTKSFFHTVAEERDSETDYYILQKR